MAYFISDGTWSDGITEKRGLNIHITSGKICQRSTVNFSSRPAPSHNLYQGYKTILPCYLFSYIICQLYTDINLIELFWETKKFSSNSGQKMDCLCRNNSLFLNRSNIDLILFPLDIYIEVSWLILMLK